MARRSTLRRRSTEFIPVPDNITPPSFTGQTMEASTLFGIPGFWGGGNFTREYQWERVDATEPGVLLLNADNEELLLDDQESRLSL